MLGASLFRLFNHSLKIGDCIVEEMKGKVHKTSQVEHVVVLSRILQALVQVSLCIFEHLSLRLGLNRLMHSVPYDSNSTQQIRISVVGDFLRALSEERDSVLVFGARQAFQSLT